MKNTLFATIALAVATMPLTFAAQAPKVATPAGSSPSTASSTSTPVNKQKSTKKSTKTHKSTKSAAVAKPAATPVSK